MQAFGYTVGLDLGQRHDYTALSIVEEQTWQSGWQPPATWTPDAWQALLARQEREGIAWPARPPLHVRHLARFPLGTPYPEIVRETGRLLADPRLAGYGYALVIDATGVGRPVLDLFREARLRPIGVTITGGAHAHRDRVTGEWSVPKRDLVSAVQSALQTERLRVASSLAEAETLTRELLEFRVTIDARTAHDSYGAWREGVHDDLVLSVALAIWYRDRWARQLDQRRQARATMGVPAW